MMREGGQGWGEGGGVGVGGERGVHPEEERMTEKMADTEREIEEDK